MTVVPIWSLSPGRVVTGADGVDYTLGRLIASGGQGAVYEEAGAGLAIKLRASTSHRDAEQIRRNLELLELLPLADLNLARPLDLIRSPSHGYVMELMSDLEAWREILVPDGEEGLAFWQRTGGLRRRFALGASLAGTMARLAELGLVYADLSPGNVLVTPSGHSADDEAWLIDVDNVMYRHGPGVFTRYFGAPELVNGRTPYTDNATDAWALAVLLFQSLSLGVHPLIGDAVDQGPPQFENRALAGHLPWVDEESDRTNAATFGIPRDRVLTRKLKSLFAQCFGPGRSDPLARPSAAQFERAMSAAGVQLVRCRSCSTDNLARPGTACLACGSMLDRFAIFRVWSHPLTKEERDRHALLLNESETAATDGSADGRVGPVPGDTIVVPANETVSVPGWMVEYGSQDGAWLDITWARGGVVVAPRGLGPIYRQTADGDFVPVGEGGWKERPDTLVLRLGDEDSPHRYLHLQTKQGRQP